MSIRITLSDIQVDLIVTALNNFAAQCNPPYTKPAHGRASNFTLRRVEELKEYIRFAEGKPPASEVKA